MLSKVSTTIVPVLLTQALTSLLIGATYCYSRRQNESVLNASEQQPRALSTANFEMTRRPPEALHSETSTNDSQSIFIPKSHAPRGLVCPLRTRAALPPCLGMYNPPQQSLSGTQSVCLLLLLCLHYEKTFLCTLGGGFRSCFLRHPLPPVQVLWY